MMEFQLSYFKSSKMILLVCFTQCASKFGKLSSGHRTGKGQLSFQFQRKKRKESESEVAQLCPTLCDPTDCSLPGSYVHGIFQARILEWVAISKKGNTKECSNYCTIPLISHASKVMLKILQARFQQYVNCEFPDVQAGFRKGRETRDQIANFHWIIDKAREFQKNIYFCIIGASLVAQLAKNPPAMQDLSSIPGLGRSTVEGKDYPVQYSGLENSMDE